MSEQDIRLKILNSLLTTPHRELEEAWRTHQEFVTQDPLFYQRLAAWYFDKGDVRDHKECFVSTLCLSNFDGHRDIGLALLRKLPPYQVTRVIDFIHKNLKRNVPRSMTTEITRYLREREDDPKWFDQTVLTARKAIKRLYALLHVSPSDRAQQIVFENDPPADSQLYVLREVLKAENPTQQAQLLVENNIPFRVASSVVKNMTPTVMFALVNSMSDQELLNNMGSLKKRGAFDNYELKTVINQRLKELKKSKKISALKGLEAVKHADLDEDVAAQVVDIVDNQVKAKGRIARPTALFIDKSSSMSEGIEIGRQMAAMISSIMDADFYCYAFDEMPIPIVANGTDIGAWTNALQGVRANGCTCNGAPLTAMRMNGESVEQIVMITDEGENRSPAFLKSLQEYAEAVTDGELPSVMILRCGNRYSWGNISGKLERAGVPVEVYEFDGDYYSLPNLIHFLTKPSKLELLIEIMNYELPKRQTVCQSVA